VSSIEYSKAFDSVRRGALVGALLKYKVHPQIIEIITKNYNPGFRQFQNRNGNIKWN